MLTVSPLLQNQPHAVMEYMEGSLHELIHNPTVLICEGIMITIIKNIAAGMAYLHAKDPPILHGDLKTKNVLVDSNFAAKVPTTLHCPMSPLNMLFSTLFTPA